MPLPHYNKRVKDWLVDNTRSVVGASLPATEAYEAFKTWCDSRQASPGSQQEFGFAMNSAGAEKKRTKRGNVYINIRLQEVW